MTVASILPFPRFVAYDANGAPLVGGLVYTYQPNSTTPKTTWQDVAETTPNTNPVTLDANGSCLLYGQGSYTIAVTDSFGNQIPAYSGLTLDAATAANISAAMQPVVAATTVTAALALMGGAIAFVNIAALRTYAGTAPPVVYVQGYYARADGGEGPFTYVASDTTSADNGGTIIVDAAGRRWYREVAGGFVTLRQFGAKGDATTDDTIAIQAACTAAGAGKFGVLIPIGQFVVSSTVNITLPITIAGVNPGIGPGVTTDANCSQILCAGAFATGDVFSAVTYESCVFRDFQIAGAVALGYTSVCPRSSGAGIHISAPNPGVSINNGSVIEHVCFSGLFIGVKLTLCSENTIVTGNYFQAWGNLSQGLYVDNGNTSVEAAMGQITENFFFGNGASTQAACLEAHCGYGSVRANKFLGAQMGVRVLADQPISIGNVLIGENSFEENGIVSLFVQQTGTTTITSVQIRQNQFSNLVNTGALQSHISVLGAVSANLYDVDISHNMFNTIMPGGGASMISVNTAANITVSYNVGALLGGTAYGIVVSAGTDDISVTDNKWLAKGGTLTGPHGYLLNAATMICDTSSAVITFVSLAGLGSAQNGSSVYVTDGAATAAGNPILIGGGSGAVALRARGNWYTAQYGVTG